MNKKALYENIWKILVAMLIFLYLYVYELNQDWALSSIAALMSVGTIELAISVIIVIYQIYKHYTG